MSVEIATEVFNKYIECFNKRDLNGLRNIFDEDCKVVLLRNAMKNSQDHVKFDGWDELKELYVADFKKAKDQHITAPIVIHDLLMTNPESVPYDADSEEVVYAAMSNPLRNSVRASYVINVKTKKLVRYVLHSVTGLNK